jgi:intracellular septation protein A
MYVTFMFSGTSPAVPITWRAATPLIQRALLRFALVGMTPIVAFYIAYRMAGSIEGIIAGTATATLALTLQAIRLRRLDPVGIVPIGAVLIQGLAGIVFQSVDLYLAAPALETSLWGFVLLGSVVVGRPLILLAATELGLLPTSLRRLPAVRRAFRQLTITWGMVSFVKTATRLYLLDALPLEAFLIVNTIVVTSINAALLGGSVWYVARAARQKVLDTNLVTSSI